MPLHLKGFIYHAIAEDLRGEHHNHYIRDDGKLCGSLRSCQGHAYLPLSTTELADMSAVELRMQLHELRILSRIEH
jgi:hypothetical protein